MGNFAARGDFKRDVDGLSPPADTGAIRAPERKLYQGKNGINKSLRSVRRKTRLSISTVEIATSE